MSTLLRQRLEEAIERSGLSKYAVEKSAGLDRGHLSTILRRGGLSRDTAARLAEVLGVSAGWLLTGDGPREAAPPASQPHPTLPMDAALETAFDPRRHKLGDALAPTARPSATQIHPPSRHPSNSPMRGRVGIATKRGKDNNLSAMPLTTNHVLVILGA